MVKKLKNNKTEEWFEFRDYETYRKVCKRIIVGVTRVRDKERRGRKKTRFHTVTRFINNANSIGVVCGNILMARYSVNTTFGWYPISTYIFQNLLPARRFTYKALFDVLEKCKLFEENLINVILDYDDIYL